MSGAAPTVVEDRRDWSHRDDPREDTRSVKPDADAGAWPEEIGDVRFYADTSLTIPGQSEPPGDCGTWGPREYCKSCGDVHIGPRRCQRRLCRECWLTWRGKQASSATRRLAGARRAADGREKRLTHTVVSPPVGEVRTLVDMEQAKQRAYEIAKEKGVRGGMLIPHGWRVLDEAKELYQEEKDAGLIDPDVGVWQWVRNHRKEWRTLTYWSPHFHVIGVGYDIGESDPDRDGGWVFSRLSNFSRFKLSDPDTYAPMFRAVSYLLSHLAYEPDAGRQSVRWFGELANNQFSLEQLADWEKSVIQRNVEKVGGYGDDDDGKRECEVEGCEGGLAPVWSAFDHLSDPVWCEEIGKEQAKILSVAFEWAIGDIVPPPGMRFPSTEVEAKEVWGHLLGQADVTL